MPGRTVVKGPARSAQLPQLTTLRFFAAMYVLVFHSGTSMLERNGMTGPALNLLKNGYLGVSFFFILSGFILTHSYLGRLSTGPDLKRFAIARFARIYPVYALALLLATPLEYEPLSDLPLALATLALVQSWGPASSPAGFFWNSPGWTLSVEFFFYILFPLVLPLFVRLGGRGLWTALAVTATTMVALRLPALTPDSGGRLVAEWMGAMPLPLLRAPEFFLGILVARFYQRGMLGSLRHDIFPLTAIAATGILLAMTSADWIAAWAAIGFAAIIATCAVNDGLVRRGLSSGPLVLLGGASYALYILQSPVRDWGYIAFAGDMALLGRVIYQPLLILVSIAVYLLLEEPARRLLRGRSLKRRTTAANA